MTPEKPNGNVNCYFKFEGITIDVWKVKVVEGIASLLMDKIQCV